MNIETEKLVVEYGKKFNRQYVSLALTWCSDSEKEWVKYSLYIVGKGHTYFNTLGEVTAHIQGLVDAGNVLFGNSKGGA